MNSSSLDLVLPFGFDAAHKRIGPPKRLGNGPGSPPRWLSSRVGAHDWIAGFEYIFNTSLSHLQGAYHSLSPLSGKGFLPH